MVIKRGRKKSLGRRKIEIKKIQNVEARQVCFSKRRNGLFKKASEISILCGAEVAAVVFSPAGKPFSFGHPSVDAVTYRFLDGKPPKVAMDHWSSASSLMAAKISTALNDKSTDLSLMVERERKRKAMLAKQLKRSEEELSALGLIEYGRRLLELKGEVDKWADKRAMRNMNGVGSGSHMGNAGNYTSGVVQQFIPVKNEMVTNGLGVAEYFLKNEVITDANGYVLPYGNYGGEGGGGLGFGNNPFWGGFQ